jgi:hypothetical protein
VVKSVSAPFFDVADSADDERYIRLTNQGLATAAYSCRQTEIGARPMSNHDHLVFRILFVVMSVVSVWLAVTSAYYSATSFHAVLLYASSAAFGCRAAIGRPIWRRKARSS